MKSIEIKGLKREAFGKKETKNSRKEGLIPCAIYGGGETVHFSVNESDLRDLIYSPASFIVNFDIEGAKEVGVMREVQFHPVEDNVLHIDFYRVQAGKPVAIDIPVKLTGNSEGVKQGGKLTLSKRKITVSGLEANLPDTIDVDITNLNLGQSVFAGDLVLENLTLLTPATTAICAVKMTRAARGAAVAAALAAQKAGKK